MRRLAVLRPEPAASLTVERAAALGIDAFAMPLFKVEPQAWSVPDCSGFDALLLTSANAVIHGGIGLATLRSLPVHAVGEATAAAAREAGFTVANSGDGGVENLLGSIDPDLRLLHLCGAHRLEADARQAITAIAVYRSDELPPPDDFGRIAGQTVAVHSPRAGRRLAHLARQSGIDRRTVRIAAISAAAAAAAGTGWDRCEPATMPRESALLALASRLCDNRATR